MCLMFIWAKHIQAQSSSPPKWTTNEVTNIKRYWLESTSKVQEPILSSQIVGCPPGSSEGVCASEVLTDIPACAEIRRSYTVVAGWSSVIFFGPPVLGSKVSIIFDSGCPVLLITFQAIISDCWVTVSFTDGSWHLSDKSIDWILWELLVPVSVLASSLRTVWVAAASNEHPLSDVDQLVLRPLTGIVTQEQTLSFPMTRERDILFNSLPLGILAVGRFITPTLLRKSARISSWWSPNFPLLLLQEGWDYASFGESQDLSLLWIKTQWITYFLRCFTFDHFI